MHGRAAGYGAVVGQELRPRLMLIVDAMFVARGGDRRVALIALERWPGGVWKVRVNARSYRFRDYRAARRAFDRLAPTPGF